MKSSIIVMMRNYMRGSVAACLLFLMNYTYAANDSNIVISNAKEYYEFVSAKNGVAVKEKLTTTYTCNSFRTSVPVSEMYNDEVQIDDVDITTDGRKNKYVTPQYSYYSVDDIFYSDEHICYFMLPLDRSGSTGEVTFEKTVKDPKYFNSIYFSESYKTGTKEITVKVPRWMKADIKEMNFDGFNIKKLVSYDHGDDADIYTYTATSLPATQSEKYCPGPTYLYPHLLLLAKSATVSGSNVTYFNSVSDQYAWYRQLVKDIDNNEETIAAKSKELIASSTSDMDKIKAILYWVQNNVRYIAFEDGMAGFTPEKADEVLRRKYGDCKGMAHLTKELLKAAGFDARLCWIGTNHIAYDYSTPSMAVDNHMICALMYKGKTYFLDATETYLGFSEYAERIQGRQVLIEDGDKYILTHVPTTTVTQNLDKEVRRLTIAGTNLTGTVQDDWKGEEKESLLSNLNSVKKDKSTEAFKKYLANDNNDCVISDFATSDVTNFDNDITANYKVLYKNAVSSFGKDNYIDLDYKKELSGLTIDTMQRHFDFWLPYKMNVYRETELAIPQGYKVSTVPANLDISNSNYHISITYTPQADKVIYHKEITFYNTKLSKSSFAKWNEDIGKLTQAYNEQLVLTAL